MRAIAARAIIAKEAASAARRGTAIARDHVQKLTTVVFACGGVISGWARHLVTTPPSDTGDTRASYDFCRCNAINLRQHFAAIFADGPDGESAKGVLSYYLALRPEFTADLVLNLGIPQAIEHEVCTHLQNKMTLERGAVLRMQAGLT